MSKISLKHSGGNVVSLNSPTNAPGAADVAFKLPNQDGSANEYLKTDGSGNLSFGAVSSDYVKLQGATGAGGTGDLIIDNLDVATYKYFDFMLAFVPATDNVSTRFSFRTGGASGTAVSGSYYQHGFDLMYPNNGQTQNAANDQTDIYLSEAVGNDTGEGISLQMRISMADSNDNGNTAYLTNFVNWAFYNKAINGSNRHGHGTGTFKQNTTTYPTGFKIDTTSGNIGNFSYILYGLKR